MACKCFPQHCWCAQHAGEHLKLLPPPAPAASPLYRFLGSGLAPSPKERDGKLPTIRIGKEDPFSGEGTFRLLEFI